MVTAGVSIVSGGPAEDGTSGAMDTPGGEVMLLIAGVDHLEHVPGAAGESPMERPVVQRREAEPPTAGPMPQRRTDQQQRQQVGRRGDKLRDGRLDRVQQCGLMQQIADRIRSKYS